VSSRLGDLRFTSERLTRPPSHRWCAETTLHHFAIVTYAVDPAALRRHLHPRFEPDLLERGAAAGLALVSVVTFLDRDFRFAGVPWARASFGQTNYRAYVADRETGEHVAWFFGTCVDSITVAIPRYAWKLPWHRARFAFACEHDVPANRYRSFAVRTASRWAPAMLVLDDTGHAARHLDGFDDLESGLVLLTHPLRGYFFRRDGALGSYAIWHDRLQPTAGRVIEARYPLLDALGLVPQDDTAAIHSVLIQKAVDFTIYLPPRRIVEGRVLL
jgi:Uncharacterized conserved protein (COG2071)